MLEDVKKLHDVINAYIRPATYPIAIRVVKKGEEKAAPEKVKIPSIDLCHPVTFCQGIAMARRYNWTMIFRKEDHGCPIAQIMLGYYSPEKMLEGTIAVDSYTETIESGKIMENANYYMPQGEIEEVWIAPLQKADFTPDVVIAYGNAAQIARMAHGANYHTGEGVTSKTFGRFACSNYIARTILENECSLVIPSGGERVFALAQDDELIFSIPKSKLYSVAAGIEAVHKAGFSRFPTAFYGLMGEVKLPPKYYEMIEATPLETS